MFKVVATLAYLVAPAFGTSATVDVALTEPFPTYRACVGYFDSHAVRIGFRLQRPASDIRAAGNIIESVQLRCREEGKVK